MAATTLERPAQGRSGGSRQAARPMIPFVRAAHQHTEGPFYQSTTALTAAAQALTPADVPAYGFLRAVWIEVSGASGNLDGGALNADYPWNLIQQVSLTDPNGNNIYYPQSGFQLYLANLFGGYVWSTDPAATPGYVGTVNAEFALRIPVEITPWDAFGSLANQNAASAYKVNVTLNTIAGVITGGGASAGVTVTVRYYLEAWSAPAERDLLGQTQETVPPGLGTTQYWSPYVPVVAAGQQTIRLTKVGNLIRNLVLVTRNTSGVRVTTIAPDPIRIVWDSADLFNEALIYRRKKMYEQTNITPPTGVYVYSFTDDQDGHSGYENRHLWLPTVQATRLEIQGVFGLAGTLEILTNDVAVTPAGR